jgi:putative flippase GtrA
LKHDPATIVRFLVNGVAATAVHFSVLWINLHVVGVSSFGLANLIAAVFGITASFLGSRHFVFRAASKPMHHQAWKFGLLYGALALMHGAVLYAWSDRLGLDYRIGFVLATGIQVVSSYFGNKRLVFRHA